MSERYSVWDDFITSKSNNEWGTESLGDLFYHRKEKNNPDLPLLAVTGKNGVVPRDSLERKDTSNRDKNKYLRVMPNDIVYNTMRMWQGVSGKSRYEGIVSPAYTICAPKNGILSEYAQHLFKLPLLIQVFHRQSQGLVDDTLNLKFENFSPIKVKIPTISEQQKIASILTSVDDVIEKTEAQINKLQDLKKGMVQELLTKGIGHTEFKDSPVGRIPREWKIAYLGKLLEENPKNGLSPKETDSDNSIYSLGLGCLTANGFSPIQLKKVIKTESVHNYILSDGDFLISRSNTRELVGLVGIYKSIGYKCIYPDLTIRLRPNKLIDNEFLMHILLSQALRRAISNSAQGTSESMVKINSEIVQKYKVPLPEKDEQKEIVKRLNSITDSILAKRNMLYRYQQIKKALMQDLLTGKVRVKVD